MSSLNLTMPQTGAVPPVDTAIPQADVQINMDSLTCPDTAINRFMGYWKGQPALFTENRRLHGHTQGGIDLHDVCT